MVWKMRKLVKAMLRSTLIGRMKGLTGEPFYFRIKLALAKKFQLNLFRLTIKSPGVEVLTLCLTDFAIAISFL